jgi:cytochrome c553
MKRVFLSSMKSVLVAMLAVSSIATASEEKKIDKADLAKGEALYTNGDAARNIPSCLSCHGTAGNATIVQNPRLAGQHAAYIHKQLNDFKGPDRSQAIMSTYAKAMTDAEMKNVAAYLDAQAPKHGAAKNKDIVALGKKIYRGGIAEKKIPACAACHSPTGAGIPSQYPRLAGQHQDYTMAQLGNFRSGARKNSDPMATITKNMSDEEFKAVADYIAGLR